jgi:ABC-type ATPase involved in cell division
LSRQRGRRSSPPASSPTPTSAGRSGACPPDGDGGSTWRACSWRGRPPVLLLDEPTNHLSVPLVEDLARAILTTPAAVVLVTHDRTLLAEVRTWPTLHL